MNLERQLVNALKSKDRSLLETVFKEIYDRYFKLVYFCVSTYVKKHEDIEDVVSDVFLNFFNHLENFKASGSIKYYLTVSAKNSAINFIKKYKEHSMDEQTTNNISYESNINKLLLDINNILDEQEKHIVLDHILCDIPLKQIASYLNENPNTIKSKYRRTIEKLKEILKGNYYETRN